MSSAFSQTPEPPYYAVIFTSQRTGGDQGYAAMAELMGETAARQPGFLGLESARSPDGFGITVSYWTSRQAIAAWKAHDEHRIAQQSGQSVWYGEYAVRIACVERSYGKGETSGSPAADAVPSD